jgi:hypothetical protein
MLNRALELAAKERQKLNNLNLENLNQRRISN